VKDEAGTLRKCAVARPGPELAALRRRAGARWVGSETAAVGGVEVPVDLFEETCPSLGLIDLRSANANPPTAGVAERIVAAGARDAGARGWHDGDAGASGTFPQHVGRLADEWTAELLDRASDFCEYAAFSTVDRVAVLRAIVVIFETSPRRLWPFPLNAVAAAPSPARPRRGRAAPGAAPIGGRDATEYLRLVLGVPDAHEVLGPTEILEGGSGPLEFEKTKAWARRRRGILGLSTRPVTVRTRTRRAEPELLDADANELVSWFVARRMAVLCARTIALPLESGTAGRAEDGVLFRKTIELARRLWAERC